MGKVFSRPEKWGIYYRRTVGEIEALGINSIPLVAIISVFIGAVITLQMALTLESPFIPKYMIGYATRETMFLEFSSTVIAIILAGKVGSNIASEIGTMRITEQIDALEIMGVNSASYLIMPKIVVPSLGALQYDNRNCRRLHYRNDGRGLAGGVYRGLALLFYCRRDNIFAD